MTLTDEAKLFTFDCYGTLIDWERGIGEALDAIPSLTEIDRAAFIERREAIEMSVEAELFRPYNEVLAISLRRTAEEFGAEVTESEARGFGTSVADWPAMPDALPFLRRLRPLQKPMAILSNVTTEALRYSVHKLGAPFDRLVTADETRSYKPVPKHWLVVQAAFGISAGEQLHIAASMKHDIRPSLSLGVPVVWVNRHREPVPIKLRPSLVVGDLEELGEALGLPEDPGA